MPTNTENNFQASEHAGELEPASGVASSSAPKPKRRPVVPRRKPWLPPDLEGCVFSGRYRMGELLGIGGMALIYKAEHIEIQKPVAVKVLHPRFADDDENARRFLEEARAASRLRHDHIIDITDSGRTEDGYVYFVLEYLNGADLQKTLEEDGPLPWIRVVNIAKQICKALAEAHRNAIIHRDIKPANCFRVTRDNNSDFIKVLDFGIATSPLDSNDPKRKPNKPNTLDQLGTPAYMAPELLRNEPYDHRVDIYALGVLMYQLLTGKVPERPLPRDKRLPGRPPRTERVRSSASLVQDSPDPDVPEQLEAIIIHAMAHDPELRFFNATEFHDALDQVVIDLTLTNQMIASRLARDPLTWRGDQDPHAAAVASSLVPMAAGGVPANAEASNSFIVTYMPLSAANIAAGKTAAASEAQTGQLLTPTMTMFLAVAIAAVLVFFGLRVLTPSAASQLSGSVSHASLQTATTTTGPARNDNTTPSEPRASVAKPRSRNSSPADTSDKQVASRPAHDTAPERGAVADSATGAAEEPAPPAPKPESKKLPKRSFDRVFKRQVRTVRERCWKYTGGMLSSVRVKLTVDPKGSVESITVQSGSPRFKSCVKTALEELKFPESKRGGTFERTIRSGS